MKVGDNAVVSIHYTLTDDTKAVLDSSEGQEPLTYLHGTGALIPGLEDELLGKTTGDTFNVSIPPEQGYGPFDEALVQKVPREAFQGVDKIEPGMQFRASDGQGGDRVITVVETTDQEVTINGNHPLAGQTLHFDVEVTAVREATEEEIAHGHVH